MTPNQTVEGCRLDLGGLSRLLPDAFWAHWRAARRETLLGWRSLIDAGLERLAEDPGTIPGQPATDEFWAHCRAARQEKRLACRSLLDAFGGWLKEPPSADQATRIEIL